MTSKERVRASFEHKQPDKLPMDFGGFCCSMVNSIVATDLKKYYGLDNEPVKIADMSTMTAILEPSLKDAMGCDVQALDSLYDTYGHKTDSWKEWNYRGTTVLIPNNCTVKDDGYGGYYVYPEGDSGVAPSGHMPANGFYFDNLTRSPEFDEDEANAEDNLAEYQCLTDADLEYYKKLLDQHKGSERAITLSPGYFGLGDANNIPGPNLKDPKGIRDISEWYTAPLLYPDYVHEVFQKEVDRAIECWSKTYAALGDGIDVAYLCGTDFGTQRGPFINPEVFKEFYLPYYKQMNDWIHKNTNWVTLKHSCGGIFEILPYLIESGFDAINPVQCSAEGMEPQKLKDTYGDKIVFWGGGVDTQKVLPFGTPDEVREQVLQRCEIFAKDGGYIFNTIHNIQANTPIPNIIAMINAVHEFNGDK